MKFSINAQYSNNEIPRYREYDKFFKFEVIKNPIIPKQKIDKIRYRLVEPSGNCFFKLLSKFLKENFNLSPNCLLNYLY